MRARTLLAVFLVAIVPALAGLQAGVADEPAGDGPTVSSYTAPATPPVSGEDTVNELVNFVKTFPERRLNKPAHLGARNAIEAEFATYGLPTWRQNFVISGQTYQNICAAHFGVVDPDMWVVVGGHYDSITQETLLVSSGPTHAVSEGAYDNGAGTRIMMTLAEAFANVDPAYSILFCAFDREEAGLQGSRQVFLAMHDQEPATSTPFPWWNGQTLTRAMLNLDMIGINWPVRAPIYCETSHSTPLRNWIDDARIAEGVPDNMFRFSPITVGPTNVVLGTTDHVHWQNAGIPMAFFISDFSEIGVPGSALVPAAVPTFPTVPGVYPFWHLVDTVETMDGIAGGRDALEAGFQTAATIAAETLAVMALHPEVAL